jgi:hypothetical protein
MTTSTLQLTDFETRLGNYLSDSGSILWTLAEKDEGIRQALDDFSRVAGSKLTLNGLDSAAATTLDQLDEELLVRGAAAYAARIRALDRAQAANMGQNSPTTLLDWAKNQAYYFDQALIKVKTRYMARSTNKPHAAVTWDESTKNW